MFNFILIFVNHKIYSKFASKMDFHFQHVIKQGSCIQLSRYRLHLIIPFNQRLFNFIFYLSVLFQVLEREAIIMKIITFSKNIFLTILGIFFVYFTAFSTISTILQQTNVKNCTSSIRCRDSNSRPPDYQSPSITTMLGLPSMPFC